MLPAAIYKLSPPGYKLEADGIPIGMSVQNRLTSVSVNLYDGGQSDQLSLSFDDSSRLGSKKFTLPKTGKKLKLWMGYELRKILMGVFHVDQASLNGSGSGQTLSVTAVPKLLLNERSQTWADTTLGDIVKKIAKENDLKAKISMKLGMTKVLIENQNRESDMSFLTKLAEKYGAMAKPAGECVLFLTKGQAVTASGIPLIPVILNANDIIQWSTNLSDRSAYEGVIATWYDIRKAEQKQVVEGKKSDQTFYIQHLFSNEDEAKVAAKSKLKELNRSTEEVSLTIVGHPEVTAGGSLVLMGLRSEVNGKWLVKSVTHTLNNSGYQSSLQCYREP